MMTKINLTEWQREFIRYHAETRLAVLEERLRPEWQEKVWPTKTTKNASRILINTANEIDKLNDLLEKIL